MVWKVQGKGAEVIKVFESFNGDLYFITEINGDEIFCFARLYAMPEFAEWGYNTLSNLKEGYGNNQIWEVKQSNWANINSYEENLLMKV